MITLAQLNDKRERLLADYYALQGAIQIVDELIALAKQSHGDSLTLDQFAQSLGAQSAEIHEVGGKDQ